MDSYQSPQETCWGWKLQKVPLNLFRLMNTWRINKWFHQPYWLDYYKKYHIIMIIGIHFQWEHWPLFDIGFSKKLRKPQLLERNNQQLGRSQVSFNIRLLGWSHEPKDIKSFRYLLLIKNKELLFNNLKTPQQKQKILKKTQYINNSFSNKRWLKLMLRNLPMKFSKRFVNC